MSQYNNYKTLEEDSLPTFILLKLIHKVEELFLKINDDKRKIENNNH